MNPDPEEWGPFGQSVLAMLDAGHAQPVRLLLDNARAAMQEAQWHLAHIRAQAVLEQALRSNDTHGQAAAFVCRACADLAVGESAAAAKGFQRALQLFHLLFETHNEGVAALGYGFASATLGHTTLALDGYARARELFRTLGENDYRAGNAERALRYERYRRRAREAMDQVLLDPALEHHATRVSFTLARVRPAPNAGESLALTVREFWIEGRPFALYLPDADSTHGLALTPGITYVAVPAPPDAYDPPELTPGDFLLLSTQPAPDASSWRVLSTTAGTYTLQDNLLAAPPPPADEAEQTTADTLVGHVVGVLKPLAIDD